MVISLNLLNSSWVNVKGIPKFFDLEYSDKISFKEKLLSLPISIFFLSVTSFVFFSLNISNSILSNLEVKDLGSKSKVSVSPTKLSS